jgi:hypothetical protein
MGFVGLLVVIGVVVGVVIGTGGSSGGGSVEADSGSSSASCHVSNDVMTSPRHEKCLSVITSEHPDLEDSIAAVGSSARKLFCWLVHDDALDIGFLFPGNEYLVLQRFTLVLVYFHFLDDANGASHISMLTVSNWLSGIATSCKWDFLSCDGIIEQDLVTGLLFVAKRLRGRIPTELDLLTALEHIDLRANLLTGAILSELWTLTQLEVLTLGVNEFEGTFPTEMVRLSKLKIVHFGSDFFTGTIPDMSALTNLERFRVKESSITGLFPSNVYTLTNLGE